MCPAGFDDVRRFAELDSTNSYLLEEARLGAPDGVVAVADHQRAGRGRLGRRWEAPAGAALLCSFLLRPVLKPAAFHLAAVAGALAAADACEEVAGVKPGLKWPNDLLVDGRKLAGVLAESDVAAPGGPAGSAALVVGIGINVAWSGPPDVGGIGLFEAAGHPVERDLLFEALRVAFSGRRPALDTVSGRGGLAAELESRCETIGRDVRIELPGRTFEATAVGLDGDGHLIVEGPSGREVVAAGDVIHLRRGSPPEVA